MEMRPNQVQFSEPDGAEVAPYRAISPLAIVALLLGLASALSLAHPVLWIVPLMGIGVAAVALRSLSQNPEGLVGRKAALAGLALAMFFLAVAPSRMALQRTLMPRYARHLAQYWLDLVREGRVYEAHQWTYTPSYRVPLDVDLKAYYESDPDAEKDLAEFVNEDTVRSIMRLGKQGRIQFVRTLEVGLEGRRGLTVLQFEGIPANKSSAHLPLRIAIERDAASPGKPAQWRVIHVEPYPTHDH